MNILIESLAVVGLCAIIACIGILTLCFMALTPGKSEDQINRYDEPPLETWEW